MRGDRALGGHFKGKLGVDWLEEDGQHTFRSSSSESLKMPRYYTEAHDLGQGGRVLPALEGSGSVDQNKSLASRPHGRGLKPLDATVDPGSGQRGIPPANPSPPAKMTSERRTI